MENTFTIVLTKGRFVVDESDAAAVLRAVEEHSPHVLVRADMLGDGLAYAPVRVVTAHVIAVTANEQTQAARGLRPV